MKLQPICRTPDGFRHRRVSRIALLLGLPLGLWSCFAAPIPELWPPGDDEPHHTIHVVYHDWHTIIVLPTTSRGPESAECYQEWEYCEKAWYLEGRTGFLGISGACRALCWPTASGVGRRTRDRPVWISHGIEEKDRWTFVVSLRGLRALEDHLESQRGATLPAHPAWYAGRRSYCLMHGCHHFTASALRAAGLPIRPWWAFSAWMVAIQFDRIQRLQVALGL